MRNLVDKFKLVENFCKMWDIDFHVEYGYLPDEYVLRFFIMVKNTICLLTANHLTQLMKKLFMKLKKFMESHQGRIFLC